MSHSLPGRGCRDSKLEHFINLYIFANEVMFCFYFPFLMNDILSRLDKESR